MIITFSNFKGGVGKTTTSLLLSYILTKHKGKKVLVIDTDPQENLTYSISTTFKKSLEPNKNVFNACFDDSTIEENIQNITNNLDLLAGELGKWTAFDLQEFTEINSTYSKTIFRLLKQWRKIGRREFKIDEFRKLLSVPDSYKNSHINERIIKQTKKDLEPYFTNLKIKTVKSNTRGTPVTGYIFTWTPEKTNEWIEDKYDDIDTWIKKQKQQSKATEDVPLYDWLNGEDHTPNQG